MRIYLERCPVCIFKIERQSRPHSFPSVFFFFQKHDVFRHFRRRFFAVVQSREGRIFWRHEHFAEEEMARPDQGQHRPGEEGRGRGRQGAAGGRAALQAGRSGGQDKIPQVPT